VKRIYLKENGKRISVEVTDEAERAITETRRAIWRNESKERYYGAVSLDAAGDGDIRRAGGCAAASPEAIYVAEEEAREMKKEMGTVFKTLTTRQTEVLKFLVKGKSVTEIARVLGVAKQSVSDVRRAVQKKFERFL
jgi:DNA-binding NarL/FixJ family response regulator